MRGHRVQTLRIVQVKVASAWVQALAGDKRIQLELSIETLVKSNADLCILGAERLEYTTNENSRIGIKMRYMRTKQIASSMRDRTVPMLLDAVVFVMVPI